jgi:hypothetical protein
MKPTSDIAVPRIRWIEWLLIFVFAGLLWLPTVDYFTGIDRTQPPGENRLPAPKPRLTRRDVAGVQNYLAAAEIYFNDHFGFRKRLIRWFQQWKARLYHDLSVHKVVPGRDGWLFTGELQMIEHYLGLAKFTPAQLKSWQTLLEKRRDWLAQRGIKYLFVIPPDKQTVYPEFLPAWLQDAAPAHRETKLDQFLTYMQAHSTVAILDLRPPLLAAKAIAPTYLQNDTHWNQFGGFVGCQEVIKTLAKQFPDLPPLRLEDFTWTNVPATGGDIARILGAAPPEKNFFTFQPGPALPVLRTNEDRAYKSNWGVKTVLTVDNPAALRRNVVVFHDSYGAAFQKFLGHSFRRSVFEWDNHEFCPALISSNAPDVVINEILERYLHTMDPEEMIAKDALP